MQTTFLSPAGVVLFTRNDMEQGKWSQEEYTVNATFPFVDGKVIELGQRICFRDPATGSLEIFEVRNVTNSEPVHDQQIIAEHIVIAELSDEHINSQEITDQTPAQALETVLTGTLWAVGTSAVTNISSVDISRGDVWQAVCAIAKNWNVYIVPRVTVNAAGAITGRYLDVQESAGVWRGLRLSVDKNMSDASVTCDDSGTLTALYGYGESNQQEVVTFADVVWSATADHPAKPSGQAYLEDPEATALYGRNGRPRFGFYQNGDITDPEILLQKTWEALKETNKPKISIKGTVSDLYRLGYKDQPIRLHDLAIVDISETGASFQIQIIRCCIDLIDPTQTEVEIGSYIANIIYINRENNKSSGGGGRGQSNQEYEESDTYSEIEKTNNMIALVVGTRNGNNYIKAGEIGLAINKSGTSGSYESTAYIDADHVNISATNTAYALAGELERTEDGKLLIKSAGGMYVQRTESGVTASFGVWDNGNLTGGIMAQKINGQTQTKISGDVIDINGSHITINADRIDINGLITALSTKSLTVQSMTMTTSAYMLGTMTYQFKPVNWKSQLVVTGITYGETGNKTWHTTSGDYAYNLVTWVNPATATINYLGMDNT